MNTSTELTIYFSKCRLDKCTCFLLELLGMNLANAVLSGYDRALSGRLGAQPVQRCHVEKRALAFGYVLSN